MHVTVDFLLGVLPTPCVHRTTGQPHEKQRQVQYCTDRKWVSCLFGRGRFPRNDFSAMTPGFTNTTLFRVPCTLRLLACGQGTAEPTKKNHRLCSFFLVLLGISCRAVLWAVLCGGLCRAELCCVVVLCGAVLGCAVLLPCPLVCPRDA